MAENNHSDTGGIRDTSDRPVVELFVKDIDLQHKAEKYYIL